MAGLQTSDTWDVVGLLADLETVADALNMVTLNDDTEDDDLSELESEKVPEEVRNGWHQPLQKQSKLSEKKMSDRPSDLWQMQ